MSLTATLPLGHRPAGLALEAAIAAERGRFAPWLAVALGIGVLVYFALPAEPSAALAWTAPAGVALAAWLGRHRPALGWVLGLLAAAWLGLAVAAVSYTHLRAHET